MPAYRALFYASNLEDAHQHLDQELGLPAGVVAYAREAVDSVGEPPPGQHILVGISGFHRVEKTDPAASLSVGVGHAVAPNQGGVG